MKECNECVEFLVTNFGSCDQMLSNCLQFMLCTQSDICTAACKYKCTEECRGKQRSEGNDLRLLHIEEMCVQYFIECYVTMASAVNFCAEVEFFDEGLHCGDLLGADAVRLVEENDICELDLKGIPWQESVVKTRVRGLG